MELQVRELLNVFNRGACLELADALGLAASIQVIGGLTALSALVAAWVMAETLPSSQ